MTCRYCANLRKCIEKATKEGYEHNVDFDAEDGCPNFGFKWNTNADRIRAMSDEELAEWISCGAGMSVGICGYCDNSKLERCDGIPCGDKTDAEIILEWLKQPAEV